MSLAKSRLIIFGGQARTGGSLCARLLDGCSGIFTLPHEPKLFLHQNFEQKYFQSLDSHFGAARFEDLLIHHGMGDDKLFFKTLRNGGEYRNGSKNISKNIDLKSLEQALGEKHASPQDYFEFVFLYLRVASNLLGFRDPVKFCCFHRSQLYSVNFDALKDADNLIFFHTIRHPMDQLSSDIARGKKPVRLQDWLIDWAISSLQALALQSDRYIPIRYEDIVSDPTVIARPLTKFGLEISPDQLFPSFDNKQWIGNSSFVSRANLHSDSILKNSSNLTEVEVKNITDTIGSVMELAGYGANSITEMPKPKKVEVMNLLCHFAASSAYKTRFEIGNSPFKAFLKQLTGRKWFETYWNVRNS